METQAKKLITINSTVNAPVEKTWESWTNPAHVTKWNSASDDWYCPRAQNDLRKGGHFSARMEAKDGSMGFDFNGTYDEVRTREYIEYTMEDGRKVTVSFTPDGQGTRIVETFEAEEVNPPEMQQAGWQAILENFSKYTESN